MMLLLASMVSCGSKTKYRPSIYGHDYMNMEIIKPVTFDRVSCGDPDFNKYVSVSLDDLSKLALVLREAKVPRAVRVIIENFNKELESKKALQKAH